MQHCTGVCLLLCTRLSVCDYVLYTCLLICLFVCLCVLVWWNVYKCLQKCSFVNVYMFIWLYVSVHLVVRTVYLGIDFCVVVVKLCLCLCMCNMEFVFDYPHTDYEGSLSLKSRISVNRRHKF